MNFLAHIYLSGSSDAVKLGNFIGDFVKGNQHQRYNPEMQMGILLHRAIDDFTDKHPITKQGIERIKPTYNRYAPIVMDLFYDHLLAIEWERWSDESLSLFSQNFYKLLMKNYFKLPFEVKSFVPFLIKNRRLESYQRLDGIEKSLAIMANHSSLPAFSQQAIELLKLHFDDYQSEFNLFMPDVKAFSENWLTNYTNYQIIS